MAIPMVCFLGIMLVWITQIHSQSNVFNVKDLGAVPDGKTDSSKALLDAWSKACEVKGTVLIPTGTFLVKPVILSGPCSSGRVTFQLDGVLKAPPSPYKGAVNWIGFENINGLTVEGDGSFDAQGASAWKLYNSLGLNASKHQTMPTSVKFNSVTDGILQGITSLNSKYFHIGFYKGKNILISNVKILAPGDSQNTDGIHISHSNNVEIVDSTIATGDDCISVGPGSAHVSISGVSCGPGHGISIGSLGRSPGEEPVSDITVTNCTLTKTDNGLRIKTMAPSPPNSVSGITFQDISMNNVENPIIIDQQYCPFNSNCGTGESKVQITDVKFINVQGSSSSQVAVNLQCSKNAPCQKIELTSIKLTYKGGKSTSSCSNVKGTCSGPQNPPPCF